ncbi:MAG TPA: hypothetical protein VNN72_03425 [Polyangiaceae bacterium]|nr:hypothetical protein [Polyangiaceae bacterium]
MCALLAPIGTSRRAQLRGLAAVALALALGPGCRASIPSFLDQIRDARQLTAGLRVRFKEATDAANLAVMADSDEASLKYAADAASAKRDLRTDATNLKTLLHELGYPKELGFFAQFETRFAEYDQVDRTVLELAVENTNLKAQRLSFGPVRDAADAFRASLEGAAAKVATKDRCRATELIYQAVLAVREIQVLQAPHIAETDELAMTRMEKDLAALEAKARSALGELRGLAGPSPSSSLEAAGAALDRFSSAGAALVKLSRRNSNVRSLDLALRVKPRLTQACDDSLKALADALEGEGAPPAR